MDNIWNIFANLHSVLEPHWAGILLILCSAICGIIIGLEREAKDKPAGVRTVSLICVGSTIFTLASILVAGDSPDADRGRIAAQVVTGIGFLGAGAIIRDRQTVLGLTTGATIWTTSAIGVLIGVGYAAAGLALTVFVVLMLTSVRRFERRVVGRCRYVYCRLVYQPANGKTRLRLLRILDTFRVPDSAWQVSSQGELEAMDIRYCQLHRGHRSILFEFAGISEIVEVQPDHTESPGDHPADS